VDEREDFKQSVLDFLKAKFPSDIWKFDGNIVRSRESNIHRLTNPNTGQKLAVKAFHKSTNIGTAQIQYDALLQYQTQMTPDNCANRVPKVYHFNEEYRYVVMEWLAGRELHTYLWRAIGNPKSQQKLAEKTGAWLRAFHDASGPTMETIEASQITERLNRRISKHAANSPVLDDPLFKEVKNKLDGRLEVLGKTKAKVAVTHDDFTPTNLMIQDDQIVGFDIWALYRKPVISDLARMIVYLSIAYPPLFGTKSYSLRHTCMAFLRGYDRDLNLLKDGSLLNLSVTTELLRRWIVIEARKPNLVGQVVKNYQLYIIRNLVLGLRNTNEI
jgi:tRNA A-37 threonylcarbamoyl transferase component Bud32